MRLQLYYGLDTIWPEVIHTIILSGGTLKKISKDAAELFDSVLSSGGSFVVLERSWYFEPAVLELRNLGIIQKSTEKINFPCVKIVLPAKNDGIMMLRAVRLFEVKEDVLNLKKHIKLSILRTMIEVGLFKLEEVEGVSCLVKA